MELGGQAERVEINWGFAEEMNFWHPQEADAVAVAEPSRRQVGPSAPEKWRPSRVVGTAPAWNGAWQLG